jgi:hypothetical protein
MVSEIYDVLYLNQIEKILRRRLTPIELGEIYVYGEFDLFVRGHHFVVEVPKYSLPYDLIDTNDMDVIYSVPYKEIIKKSIDNGDGTMRSKYSWFEMTRLRYQRPTSNQYKTGEHFIELLCLLDITLNPPKDRK